MDGLRNVELRKTVAAIAHLKELQPDWDSYDGERVDLASQEHAKEFVAQAAHAFGETFWTPKVGPTADGGVALVWRKPGVPTKAEALFSPVGDRFIVFQGRRVLAQGPIKGPEFLKLVVG